MFSSGKNGSKRAHIWKQQMKTVIVIFFDIKGTVHFEFFEQGQTVSQAYYMELLKRLHETVRRKTPEVWPKY
jgi:hypothetical protein